LSDTEELSGDEESDSVSELKLKEFQEIFHKSFRAGGWHKRKSRAFWFMCKFLISARGAGKQTQSSEVPKIAAGKIWTGRVRLSAESSASHASRREPARPKAPRSPRLAVCA
jgi:hypothetical protein